MTAISFVSPGGRLRLRTPEISDAANLHARVADKRNVAYLPHLLALEQEVSNVEKWIARMREGTFKGENAYFVVELLEDNRVIGEGGLGSIDIEKRSGEGGIMLEWQATRKGYAAEALNGMFWHAFTQLGLETVTLGTLEINEPMRSLLEKKFGLVPEIRDAKVGRECQFTMRKEDWEAQIKL